MKKKQIGFYDYTVILTYCGMLFAFMGILQVLEHNFWTAIFCLMLAGVCDMFDGAVASTKQRTAMEKKFGIQIDSLSDLISFGVFPALFIYILLDKSMIVGVFAGIYVLCGLIRLAYFNVTEEERQSQTTEKRQTYLGVPVTTIAILLPTMYLLFDSGVIKSKLAFLILMIVVACGFVTPVEIKKPHAVGKALLMIAGAIEAVAMIVFVGWGAV